jgi:hypothetical protein
LHPWALRSFSLASYDSQGYDWGILIRHLKWGLSRS